MNSEERQGQQLLTTVRFLQQIYQDLVVLVEHTDKVFDEHGWIPTERKKVFAHLGNRLNAKAWLLTRLYRFYIPRPAGALVDRVIAMIPILDPPRGYDEPICTACVVTFSRSVKPGAFVGSRRRFRALLEQLEGQIGVVEIPSKKVESLYPQATHARIVVTALYDLSGERELVERLVFPALKTLQVTP